MFDEVQEAIQKVADTVGPAVVGLRRGSGIVTAKNQVLTVAHVLRGEEATVTFQDGRSELAAVAGIDGDVDIAVLTVDTGKIEPVGYGTPPRLGEPILALANPGGHGLRVTFGMVSATGRMFRGPRGRQVAGSIEHTAPLPRGSSGGPVTDQDGRLLGLNAVRREGGLILAVPVDPERIEAVAAGRIDERPRLGVALAHPRQAKKLRAAVGLPAVDGLLVRAVVDGSPAAAGGLEQGDLLTAANGTPLKGVDDLFAAIDGAALKLRVLRGTEEREVEVHFSS